MYYINTRSQSDADPSAAVTHGRLRPKDVASVKALKGKQDLGRSAPAGGRGNSDPSRSVKNRHNPSGSASHTNHASNASNKPLSRREQHHLEFRAFARQITDGNLPHAKRMVVIQTLNETFLQAQSIEEVAFQLCP
jgi:hypothetical protein